MIFILQFFLSLSEFMLIIENPFSEKVFIPFFLILSLSAEFLNYKTIWRSAQECLKEDKNGQEGYRQKDEYFCLYNKERNKCLVKNDSRYGFGFAFCCVICCNKIGIIAQN